MNKYGIHNIAPLPDYSELSKNHCPYCKVTLKHSYSKLDKRTRYNSDKVYMGCPECHFTINRKQFAEYSERYKDH